jgi:uncharacterized protein (TIGR03435 family)
MRAQSSMLRVALSAAMLTAMAYAQTDAEFQVSPAGARRSSTVSRTPQSIAFQTAPLGNIIAFAYGLPPDRVERRPQWMYDDYYDVAVTTAAPTGLPEQKLLLQKLLEERFGLVAHRISYPSPVYFLVPAEKVNLTEAKETDAEGLPEFRAMSMSDLAAWLYSQVKLPVLDKTGLTGFFDIEVPGLPLRGGAEGTIRAVHNALGLNLEVHQGTAESLIIDRVERPSQN